MTAIVMNTLTGAVSEYDWTFQSITPTHAGDALGLYALGGSTDNSAAIDAEVLTGKTLWGSSLKKLLDTVYFSIKGTGLGKLLVTANDDAAPTEYQFVLAGKGQSRAKPARGVRANYLAFGFRNVDGGHFQLDRIEVPAGQSDTRRV